MSELPSSSSRFSTLTSPRLRPGGPRTRKATTRSVTPLALNGFPEEHRPASHPTSGRGSPTFSSNAGSVSSPFAPSFDQLSSPSEYPDDESAPRIWREQGVQAVPEDPTPPTPPPSASTRSSTPAVKVIAKPLTLAQPPALDFESVPIQWRGMTLESAQWNMNQAQLQEIVSRAIRRTAQESFIRLLPPKTLDEELVAELERLDTAKATAQSQYRFNMHRRTMLLQSLLTLASGDGDYTALGSLITQLAEVTAACDKLMLELVRVADQRAQIQRIQDVHVSSALAMALRKLNASYAKRTGELREAREQIDTLKAELEEAWKVAEDMAQEMDDLDNFHSGFSSGSEPEDDDTRMDESVRMAEVIGVTGKAVAMKATLTQLVADRAKERNDLENRSQRVSAARKRSSRASKASLRLPRTSKVSIPSSPADGPSSASVLSRRSRSRSRTGSVRRRSDGEPGPLVAAPPVPIIVVDTASLKKGPKDDSFLEMAETRPVSPATPVADGPPPPLPDKIDARTATARPTTIRPTSVDPALARSSSLDFEVPPIAIFSAEGDAVSYKSSRRVHSYQPPLRPHSVEPDEGLKRPGSRDFKKFDGWPFGSTNKAARRRSLPLSGSVNMGRPDSPTRSVPPPRVFSPPP